MDRLGPYRIVEKIGEGAMGVVYVGRHTETEEYAALKVLPSGGGEGFRARFEGEIETLRQLRHPNIVQLYGFGDQDGQLFYAMERVDGENLEARRVREGMLPWREVLEIGIQIAAALRHAHARGVIHRDLKPANLIQQPDGAIKVADFGVARLWGYMGLTSDGSLVGTPNYMSPEQAEGRAAQERSDLYSVGCVFYALLSGRPPFLADTAAQMLQLQLYAQPAALMEHAPHVPPALASVVDRLLRKAPDERIGSAHALLRRLEDARAAETANPAPGQEETPSADTGATGREGSEEGHAAAEAGETVASDRAPPEETRDPGSGDGDQTAPRAGSDSAEVTRVLEDAPGEEQAEEEAPSTGESFVTVEEAAEKGPPTSSGAAEDEERTHWTSLLSSVATLLLLIGAFAGLAWLMQPPSADALYARIEKRMESGELEEALEAASAVDAFLSRFPKDPRAAQVRRYQARVERARTHRRLALQARTDGIDPSLEPAARAYVKALRAGERDPAEARKRFRALASFFGPASEAEGVTRHCVLLAENRAERLAGEAEAYVQAQREALTKKLQRAKEMRRTNPDAARRRCAALLALYEDKAWAEDLCREARSLRRALTAATRPRSGAR